MGIMASIGAWRDLSIISLCSICIGGFLTDGESIDIALEDLTVESIGISKVRTLLADVQMRRPAWRTAGGAHEPSPLADHT